MLRNDSMESPFGSVKEIDLENVEHREIIARELASRFRTLSVLVKGETDYLFIPFIPNGIATRALTRPEFLEFGDDSVAVEYDIFVDDEQSEWDTVCVRLPFRGAPKRCGGQGDILSGVLAVFLMWARRTEESNLTDGSADYIASKYADYIAAVAAACYLVKASARAAYVELGRSMQAEDVLARVASQFSSRRTRPTARAHRVLALAIDHPSVEPLCVCVSCIVYHRAARTPPARGRVREKSSRHNHRLIVTPTRSNDQDATEKAGRRGSPRSVVPREILQ